VKFHLLVCSQIDRPINLFLAAVFVWASFLLNVLPGLVALVPTAWDRCCSWCWITLSKFLCLPGVIWWISLSNCCYALWWSTSDHLVVACRALFKCTWNCLRFDIVTFWARYTRTSIAARIVCMYCSHNRCDSIANSSFTLAFADFDIVSSRKKTLLLVKSVQCII
jgi:hypothetical protein